MRLSRCAGAGTLGAFSFSLLLTAAHGQERAGQEKKEGLRFRLGEAGEDKPARSRLLQEQATHLYDAEAEKVLRRLPSLAPDESRAFALREKSLPPPRAGRTIQGVFPPKGDARRPETRPPAPLRVVRYGPSGSVPVARRLNVTFSAPMVPVTSTEGLARQAVPVRLTPEPPGRWRWVGTQTLLFEPDGRFPMATDYEVEIPAGARAQNDATLAAATRWSFATPPPKAVSLHPEEGNQPIGRDPLFFVGFDQRIDPQAVLATIRLEAGDRIARLRLATAEEIEGDTHVQKNHVQQTQAGHWLAFRAEERLPFDTRVTVTIGPGTPSAEGPTATREHRVWRLRTYGPLRIVGQGCSGDKCLPGDSWTVRLSNPIDVKAFRKEMVRVDPLLAEMKVAVYGSSVQVSGRSVGGEAYGVTLSGSISDTFGEALEKDETVTFDVVARVVARDTAPRLWARSSFAVLDPTAPPRFPVYSRGLALLKVQAYRVTPEDFSAFQFAKSQPIGSRLFSREIPIENPQVTNETWLDLEPALVDGVGQVVLTVEPAVQPDPAEPLSMHAWVQATRISLDAFSDDVALFASVSSLSDGSPIAGAEVQLVPAGQKGATGSDGLATIALANPARLLVARRGNDVAILPAGQTGQWQRRPATPTLRWYVFDGRGLYRPGDDVKVKGWLRLVGGGAKGDVALPRAVRQVRYVLEDAEDNEVAKGAAPLNAMGGFDLSLRLPPTINLGETNLSFEVDAKGVEGLTHQHTIGVLEFRRPEFEVTASASQGPFTVGDSATLTVSASYFAGGGLPEAQVKWDVEASPGSYRPPNRDEYVFGAWTPWWEPRSGRGASNSEEHEGRTDPTGKHRLRIDFESADPPQPMNVHAEATVEDVNRQELTARAELLVHPADVYVGVKTARLFVWRDSPASLDVIVTDLDGTAVAGRPVDVRAEGLDWEQEFGQWTEKVVDSHDCALESRLEPVRCTFTAKAGGRYRVTATVTDRRGRKNRTVTSLWAGGFAAYGGRGEADVTLIPDKTEYRPGDTAEILVMAPFAPAEGVLTLRRSGILRAERFRMDERSRTLRVKIDEAWTPNVHAQVDLTGATPASLRQSASATLALPVPPLHRTLSLKVAPRETSLAPGGTTVLDAQLLDANAKPVAGGEMAVVVVDEAVLSLLGAPGVDAEIDDESDASPLAVLQDPMRTFYETRYAGGRDEHLRASVLATPVAFRPSPSGSGAQTSGSITHEPVGCLVAGQFPLINATIEPPASVARARVYFKLALGAAYYVVEMTLVGGEFIGKLPKPKLEASPITYYIFSIMTDGSESQTAEVEARVVGDESECPADVRVAEIGPPGAVTLFSATTAAVAVPVGFAAGGMGVESIPLRADFNALALFAASVRTDAHGRATVPLKLPDNLTRYRIRAVAAEGNRFGRAESTVTARLPLMVRQSPPRFLNFGDRFELPVVIQNQTGAPLPVDVAVRARNADLLQGNGRRVTVPANDRVEVRFPMAARRPGAARIQVGAVSGALADASELRLPVWTPATTEAFATYGQIDAGAITQPVAVPAGVAPEVGGLEITTSSTALQALTDAVLYLVAYPYECSEQLASRVLAVAALRDVLSAFKADGLPPPEEMIAAVKRDLQRLQQRQRDDGGFGFWKREEAEALPYVDVHVAHALQRAKLKGFDVPKEMLERAHGYLRNIESHIPARYGAHARRSIVAYALYVRQLMGDRDGERARALLAETGLDGLPLESVGWLLPVLSGDPASTAEVVAIHKHLANRVSETAAAARFTTFYGDDAHLVLYSDRRVDALLLEGLIVDQPASDLIPKLVEGLLGDRKAGRWANTQECSFVLLALDRYFNAYEKVTPDFMARAWLGPRYAGEQRFKGRSKDRQHVEIPMRSLVGAKATDLVVAKQGKGRLYYRIGLKYSPESLRLQPADFGFSVERSYEPIDDKDDVRRDAEGAWHVKPGARVRVRVRMATPDVRHHVALVDPLPAGLEPLNPELATTASIPEDEQEEDDARSPWTRWLWCWFDHQNLRDDRVEAFTTSLQGGVYDYTYVARATTPGDFVVPPPRAEEMYHPESFGRGGTDRVIIK